MPEVQMRLGPKLIAELEEMAEELEVTRAETIRQVLRFGLDAIYETDGESDDEDEEESENDDEETGEEESKPKRRRKRSKHLFG